MRDEFPPRGAVVQPALRAARAGRRDLLREIERERHDVRRAAALQAFDGFDDFERIAHGGAERLIHRREQVVHLHAHLAADGGEAGGELLGFRARFHEGAGAEFHIEHEPVERLRELLAHDARDDQRLRRHGAR